MNDVISLLDAVYHTMDTIAIVGIDNQDKFVGCAKAVQSVGQQLRTEQAEKAAPENTQAEKEE